MNEIKLTPELREGLGHIRSGMKLVDENGLVEGIIITPYMQGILEQLLGQEQEPRPTLDDGEYYTTAEVRAYLEDRFPGFGQS